jgi:hypothetical protein
MYIGYTSGEPPAWAQRVESFLQRPPVAITLGLLIGTIAAVGLWLNMGGRSGMWFPAMLLFVVTFAFVTLGSLFFNVEWFRYDPRCEELFDYDPSDPDYRRY